MNEFTGELAELGQRLQEGEALTSLQVLGLLARFYPGYSQLPHPSEDDEEEIDASLFARAQALLTRPTPLSGAEQLERLEERWRQTQALIEDDEEDLLAAAGAFRGALDAAWQAQREGDLSGLEAALERVRSAQRRLDEG